MKNVTYHYAEHVAAHIHQLQGQLVPTTAGQPIIFDDKTSFTLAISSAEIAISTDSLARVLNEYLFDQPDAPIKDVSIQARGNSLLVKGKLHQKGDVTFETTGTLTLTPEGQIRVHTQKLKAAHLPLKGILDLLGIKLAKLIDTRKVAGVSVDGNDVILDPKMILPPPKIEGAVTAVRLVGSEIVQTFGSPDPGHKFQPGNYMAYRGNRLRFGKLTMDDTDLVLLDMDPRTPFDFFLDRYKDQLVAGYTKTTKEFGLRVYMRDFDQLNRAGTEPRTQAATAR